MSQGKSTTNDSRKTVNGKVVHGIVRKSTNAFSKQQRYLSTMTVETDTDESFTKIQQVESPFDRSVAGYTTGHRSLGEGPKK